MAEHIERRADGQLSFKQIAIALVAIVLSLVTYIYLSGVQVQVEKSAKLEGQVDIIRTEVIPGLKSNNDLLTRLIQQHEDRITKIESQK
ncbi:MAG: hypothetical protein Q8L86_12525 [Vicinamibacterales bacterium]|nr:hypothetical protein [Vicinamibacterales bacterium]